MDISLFWHIYWADMEDFLFYVEHTEMQNKYIFPKGIQSICVKSFNDPIKTKQKSKSLETKTEETIQK